MEGAVKQKRRRAFLTNTAFFAVIIAIFYFVLKYLINLVMPFFLALIMAALTRPLTKLLSKETRKKKGKDGTVTEVPRKIRLNKKVASILSVVILFLLLISILTGIVAWLYNTGADILSRIPGLYYNTVQPGLINTLDKLKTWLVQLNPQLLELLENSSSDLISSLGAKITEITGNIIGAISSAATAVPSALLKLIICLIATMFIAVDFDRLKAFIKKNLPERTSYVVSATVHTLVDVVGQFIRSYALIFLITAAEIFVGMLIVGQKRALLLAILIATFDAFPIVGSGMILLPFSIITLISGHIGKGIGLAIVYVVVVVVRQIIEPKIVGKQVGLSPIVTLFSMYVGTKLFGGIGLFALPITAAILTVLNESGTLSLFKRAEEEVNETESAHENGGTDEA